MYKAIYREFRPISFDEIIGEDHITKTLKNQIKNKKTGHAYLFSGERGTGKTTSARIFSRAVNCLDLRDGNPCNECVNCKLSLNEETTDIIEMDAASNRSIVDIKSLKETLLYPPVQMKYKVYIIDEVHMLSNEAFNALLKSLEEPPEYLIFILATTEPEKLPDTILSRCQRFDFRKVPGNLLRENIINITKSLNREIDEDAIRLIIQNSGGSVRDSLSILDRLLSYSRDKISLEDGLEVLGNVDRKTLTDLLKCIFYDQAKDLLYIFDSLINSGKDVYFLLKDIISLLRDLLMIKIIGEGAYEMIFLSRDEFDSLKSLSDEVPLAKIRASLNKLLEIENTLKWSGEPRILLEASLISLTDLPVEEEVSKSGVNKKIKPIEKKNNVIEKNNETSKEVQEENTNYKDKAVERKENNSIETSDKPISGELWQEFLSKLSPGPRAFASRVKPVCIIGDNLIIDPENITKEQAEFFKTEQNTQEIKQASKEVFGQELEFKVDKINEKKKDNNDLKAILDYFGEENVIIRR
ncbi:MAG: DNA polymerase III subunit gamma/tau [Tissierellia bacterium]|nr:DNA polymerase III subunit gamma/tau [Tissierellia bacterium]